METPGLAALGEDLLLLVIGPSSAIGRIPRIEYGLMGSELIRLAAAGRVAIAGDRIVVRSTAPTGDTELDGALAGLAISRAPLSPAAWVSWPRPVIRDVYLKRLAAAGVLRAERGFFTGRRYRVADAGRVAGARARLDAIAGSQGPVDVLGAAFAGLVCATGLDRLVYVGPEAGPQRARLAEVASGRCTAGGAGLAGGAGDRTEAAAGAAAAAVRTSRDAADAFETGVDAAAADTAAAALQAAATAAMNAAVQAAVQAAASAAEHPAAHAAHTGSHDSGSSSPASGHSGHHH